MKLENQVVSLELAKKLKELGVKEESLFYWGISEQGAVSIGRDKGGWLFRTEIDGTGYLQGADTTYAAFTVAELGEMLPKEISSDTLNKRFPWHEVEGDDNEEAAEKLFEDFQEVMPELYDHYEYKYEKFGYPLKLDFWKGNALYYFISDPEDVEYTQTVFEIEGATEADARAKMLIYLLENKLITV